MTENKNLENLPVPGEEQWELEERMKIHHSYSKSRYPPMCIEPMPYERQRLNGQGMTPEERALRKQWLLDQYLKPHEPPNSVEALETMNLPVNPIKRMFRMPMDVTFRMLTPVIVSCVCCIVGTSKGSRSNRPHVIYKIKWKYRYLTWFSLPNATCLLEKQKYQFLPSLALS